MKLELHVLRYGDALPEWMRRCAPTLAAWAERHGIETFTWDDGPSIVNGYPCPKFCEIDMVEKFLKGENDFMLYADLDIWVHPDAPLPPLLPGISMATDCYHAEHREHWVEWCRTELGIDAPENHPYCNAGVWICDRESAKLLLEAMRSTPMVEFFQEQHWLGICVATCGAKFNLLPGEWNRFGPDFEPAWARHFWADDKIRDFDEIEASGMLYKAPDGLRYNFHPGKTPERDKVFYLQFIKDSGLGNRLFELAAGWNLAKKLGIPMRLNWLPTPKRDFGLEAFGIGCLPFRHVPVVSKRLGQGNRKILQHATKAVVESEHRVLAVAHPFQSEECFTEVADDIRELFKLEPFPLEVPDGKTAVGVQVRRGDYIGHPRLNVVTPDYFRNAMEWMRAEVVRPHFFIVSDDPAWCRREFEHLLDVTVMPPQEAIDGLRTLASCEAHVISNSTFGWWGAWLGEKGPVVVPEIWHHKPGSYGDWNPVPERWHRVSVKPAGAPVTVEPIKARMVVEQAPPSIKRAIVYPWHADQAKWHELRYSLRSIGKHFADKDCPVFIMGTRRPDWLVENPRVKYLGAWSYQDALSKGLQIAETVMWMNDDIVLLKDVGWQEVSVPRYVRPIDPDAAVAAPEQSNPWREGCRKVMRQLVAEGVTDLKLFSTHTPYVYQREKVLEVLRRFGMFEKMPLEIAYYSLHQDGATEIGDDRVHELPLDGATYLNYTDRHLTPALKDELRRRFPDFAPWELRVAFNG